MIEKVIEKPNIVCIQAYLDGRLVTLENDLSADRWHILTAEGYFHDWFYSRETARLEAKRIDGKLFQVKNYRVIP